MNEKQFDKKIVLSVIIAICSITMISSVIELLVLFMMRNVNNYKLWQMPENQYIIVTFILAVLIVVILCSIVIKQVFLKNISKKANILDLIFLNIGIALILALIILSIIYNNFYFTEYNFHKSIDSAYLTPFLQLVASTSALLIASITSTIILYISTIKAIKSNNKEKTVQK